MSEIRRAGSYFMALKAYRSMENSLLQKLFFPKCFSSLSSLTSGSVIIRPQSTAHRTCMPARIA